MRKKLLACLLSVMFIVGFSLTLPAATTAGSESYVMIIRDNYGVPHIFSNTKEGLGFGCGYAMAQDRLWQADVYRRAAFGSLAEFGMATIEQDYATRSMGYSREELREIFDNWVPTNPEARLKEMAEAFVDGVNLYIYQALAAAAEGDLSLMPIEYLPEVITPDGLPLEPWTIEDSVAIVVMMAWRFGGCGGGELGYAAALQALQAMHGPETGWLIFNDIYPQNDPGAEVTIPSEGCSQSCVACLRWVFQATSATSTVNTKKLRWVTISCLSRWAYPQSSEATHGRSAPGSPKLGTPFRWEDRRWDTRYRK